MATKQIKTYRVLHENMRVGDSVRGYGDLMPEAAKFTNLRAYLSTGQLEEVFMDPEDVAEWEKEQKKKDAARIKALEQGLDPDDDLSEDEEDEEEETPKPVKKKIAAKKKTVKKSVKTTKKG